MYKNRPQTLGAGTTTRYITFDIESSTSSAILNLGNQLYTDNEIQTYMQRYNYMRIEYIKAKVEPSNTTGRVYLLGEWNRKTTTITADDLTNNDNTKIVAVHAVRYQTRTWLPPDMIATAVDKSSTNETISTINLRKYNRTDDYYYCTKTTTPIAYSILYPFNLAVKSTISCNITIIVKVHFRGEKYTSDLGILQQLLKEDEELKRKVEEIKKSKQITNKVELKKVFDKGKQEKEEEEEEEKEEQIQHEDEGNENENNQQQDEKENAIKDIINKIKNL
jgi:hypothetical protein